MKRIYLDYAAATPLDKKVKKVMDKYWDVDFGNPGAIHQEGFIAKQAVADSRQKVAKILNSQPGEIIFTSGGTESNSLAILGTVNNLRESTPDKKIHIITTKIEHPSVLEAFQKLEKEGVEVDYLNVKSDGLIDINDFKTKLRPETSLVSIIYAHNEMGSIQPITKISKIIRSTEKKSKIIFHIDASQAPLYLNINVNSLGIDLMTLDAQKIYGPKGAGILYIKKGIEVKPILIGGSQEQGLRPGTENVPLIVGFAKALELSQERKEKDIKKTTILRDYFIHQILTKIPGSEINGSITERLPNNINISFPDIQNTEFVVIKLDSMGIACSTKSACMTDKESLSYSIQALNKSHITNAFRFTLGRSTKKKDLDYVVKSLQKLL